MFAYYIKLALLALRRTPVLSTLMVLAIALGLATAMTSFTVLYRMSANPIPHKSEVLYAVQVDNWDAEQAFDRERNLPPDQLTHRDSRQLLAAAEAPRQVAMYRTSMVVVPEDKSLNPQTRAVRAASTDFFAMFDTPFLHGGPWTKAEDDQSARVAVIGRELNERVFKGENSVGRLLRLDQEQFRIIGVLDTWKLQPLFYDLNAGALAGPEEIFIPFSVATQLEKDVNGSVNCFEPMGEGYRGLIDSECIMSQFWVELPDAASRDRYLAFLDRYTDEQRALGRFERPNNNRLVPVMQWLTQNEVIPDDTYIFVGVGAAFLIVCLLNATGLLLAKFLRKTGEIGLRRALGARRGAVFVQHLVESGLIGLLGAATGLLLTLGGLALVRSLWPDYGEVAVLDAPLFGLMLLLAVGGALLSGAYPAWRACRVAPASQLKTN